MCLCTQRRDRIAASIMPYFLSKLMLLVLAHNVAKSDARYNGHGADFPSFAPLLISKNGTAITSASEWNQLRRSEVRADLEAAILGAWPPTSQRPTLLGATLLNTTTFASGATSNFYNLEFLALKSHVSFQVEVRVRVRVRDF